VQNQFRVFLRKSQVNEKEVKEMAKEYVKNYIEQIKTIKKSLDEINEVIQKLPDSSWKKSLNTSAENFQKKIDSFLAVGGDLTEEQKKAIAAIKSGKVKPEEVLSKVPADMEIGEPETSKGSNDEKQAKKVNKVKKATS